MPGEEAEMKNRAFRAEAVFVALFLVILPAGSRDGAGLPDCLRMDLKRLKETWHVLDQFADKIWPGWKGYQDVPFRFQYPNNVQMLVGHPSPTDGFELIAGADVRGKQVYLDRRQEIPIELKPPLSGGGGIIPFGKDTQVQIVDLHMAPVGREAVEAEEGAAPEGKTAGVRPFSSENQILINIHELFHCFQKTVYRYRFGNLMFNTDANYATYAEVEGLALENAYLEPEEEDVRDALKDFLAARMLKRRSMTEAERNQESEDDLMEGTSVYAETMAVELIKRGFEPLISASDDPFYRGFRDADRYLKDKLDNLKNNRTLTMDSRGKCYPYGCFQALLLTRLFPGWQTTFFQDGKFLDQVLQERLGLTEADIQEVASGLKDRYPLGEISARHGLLIEARDKALAMMEKRRGRTYVVNFKPLLEYVTPQGRGESYKLGLVNIFPEGIESIELRDVSFRGEKSPIVWDQLYYAKWVDPKARARGKGYTLKYSRKEGEDVYYDAEFRTGGFVLLAPKIQVREHANLVKATILAKLKPAEKRDPAPSGPAAARR
jgi:hypothetical protein